MCMSGDKKTGYFLVLTAGVFWGFIGLFVSRLSALGVETGAILFLRIGFGALIMAPVIFLRGGLSSLKIDLRGLILTAIMGLVCQAFFNYAYTISIKEMGASAAVVLLYTAPAFVAVMSRLFFSEAMSANKISAIFINICGCFLTVTNGNFNTESHSALGITSGIMAGFFYSLVTIIGKKATSGRDPFAVTFYSFIFGAFFVAVISRPWENILEVWDIDIFALGFLFGLISTVGSYIAYMSGLSKITEISKAPVFASVETPTAACVGIFMLGEQGGIFKYIGILLVVISIAVMSAGSRNDDLKRK